MEKWEYNKKIKEWNELLYTDPKRVLREAKEFTRGAVRKKDIEMEAFGSLVVATTIYRCGVSEDVMRYAIKAETYYSSVPTDLNTLLRAKTILAVAYQLVGDYSNSLRKNLEVLEIIKKNHLKNKRASGINNLSEDYRMVGDIKTAIRMLKGEYELCSKRKKKDQRILYILSYNLADTYLDAGDVGQAEHYMGKCTDHAEHMGRTTEQFINERLLSLEARVCYAKGENDRANRLADELYETIRNGSSNFTMNEDYAKIASYQIDIGEYDRADHFIDHLWAYGEKTRVSLDIIRAGRLRAKYHDAVGSPEKAVEAYKTVIAENDRWALRQRKIQLASAKAVNDVTEQIERLRWEYESKEIMANRDPLTQVFNRRAFSKLLERSIEDAKRKDIHLGCVFLDVDNFKMYNDAYGHLVGDEVLRSLGRALLSLERENVYSARYGGDEFFVVLVGYPDEEVKNYARELMKRVKDIDLSHESSDLGSVTVSVGIINMKPRTEHTVVDVIKYSDDAMYYSKEAGKDRVCMLDTRSVSDDIQSKFEIVT